MNAKSVDPIHYSSDYFLSRCGGIEFFNRYGSKILKPMMQAALKAADLKMGYTIVDVGCGRGEMVAHLSDRGFNILGMDYSKEAIALAKRVFPASRFECVDGTKKDFPPQTFDRIFFLGTIEHLYDNEIESILAKLHEGLTHRGEIVVTTCTNKLYYKVWSYKIRKFLARIWRQWGGTLKDPEPPRSEEDKVTHINEQHYFSLRRHLARHPWTFKIIPQQNPKLKTIDLYGPTLPNGFPLKAAPVWKQHLYRIFIFWFPLNLFLARAYLIVARKAASPP